MSDKISGIISLKGIIDEDFCNYKVPSTTLMFPKCSFKCGSDFCQNSSLANAKTLSLSIDDLCKRYINNPITQAVVCQGLDPMDSFIDLVKFIWALRVKYVCLDDIVIYTGYDKDEIPEEIQELSTLACNIVVKYGRYIPDQKSHYDEVLGVKLASDNQYAERIS